jgi:putative ABC transport system permease protein
VLSRLRAYTGEAFAAIWRNRTRSVLTMLGMIIGTASIISVLGISRAASGGIKATISSFGDAGIVVSVDPNQDDPSRAQVQFRDIPRLESMTSGTIAVYVPNLNATYRLRANGIAYETTVSSQTDYATDNLQTREGRRMSHDDVASAAHVALLSHPLARRFFGDAPAVGRVIRVGGSRFTIVGIYADFQSSLIANIGGGDYIEIPYSTFHEIKPGPMDFLQAYPRPGVSIADAGDAVQRALQRIHGERARYVVQDTAAQIGAFNSVLSQLAVGLTSIGAVSLVVAGIGIMNIMLVSVAERTREIGLRKSIGASRRDILTQFLLEAILLSLIGGGIGMLLGIGAVLLAYVPISAFVGPAPIPYLLIVSVAVGFSTLVGCVFGSYPAWRAARLDPVVALRS